MAQALLSMVITLAPLAPDMLHIRMCKHTCEAYQSYKDPAPPVHPWLHECLNILWPSEGPRELPRVFCRSVHKCESSGTLSQMEMTGGILCVVVGPSELSGFD